MEKVLIVEDSASAAALLAGGLEQHTGLEYEVASNLREAEDILESRAEDFFLALCDLNLPDCPTGKAVDVVLKYKLAAVVVTAMYDEQTRSDMLSRDIADYIVKQNLADLHYLFRLVRRIHSNRNLCAMVVDDSKSYRERMRNLLLRQRIQTYAVERGSEALDILTADPNIKLVLTDYHMPDMDGLELIQAIRRGHGMDQVAIIGTSSTDHEELSHTFLKSGANDFMTKTAPVEELVCRINMNLDMMELLDRAAQTEEIDQITGLHNKRHLFREGTEALERWRRKDRPPHLALIRVDGFDSIALDHGWFAGDEVLKNIAGILKKHLSGPSLLARLGGGSFCAVNLSPLPVDSERMFHAVREEIESSPTVFNGENIHATVSLAVDTGSGPETTFPARLARIQDLLEVLRAHGPSGFRVD